jgi:hypothetical protein
MKQGCEYKTNSAEIVRKWGTKRKLQKSLGPSPKRLGRVMDNPWVMGMGRLGKIGV